MNGKSNKILIFTTAFRPLVGGSEIAIESIARNLPDIYFDIVTPRVDSKLSSLENDGNIRIYRVGLGTALDKFFFPISGAWLARDLVKDNSYLAVHTYQASYGALAALILKIFIPSVRLILTLQEGKDLNSQSILIKIARKIIIRNSDRITAISFYLAEYAKNHTKRPVIIIPNGVDLDLFNPTLINADLVKELRQSLSIFESDKVVITSSRLVEKNGISDIIDSAGQVIERFPNTKFLIVGDGPLWQMLNDQAANSGHADKIIFTGSVKHRQLPLYLAAADLFVRPSTTEGLGNSFLEAMAMGLPVLGTPVGGIVDFISDNKTGFLWKKTESTLAQKIISILENYSDAKVVAENGKALVARKYNWPEIAAEFRNIYNEQPAS